MRGKGLNLGEVKIVIDWGKAFQVAFVGLSGVFAGLVLLEICVNVLARIVRMVEGNAISKK
jgi:hypothetical protein